MPPSLQTALDALWRIKLPSADAQPFPGPRMRNLLVVMTSALRRRVQASLSALDVWAAPWLRVRTAVRDGVRACEAWTQVTTALTTTAWPACDTHRWTEGAFTDPGLLALTRRLEDISRLRRYGKKGEGWGKDGNTSLQVAAPLMELLVRATSHFSTHEEVCSLTTPEGRRGMGLDAALRLLAGPVHAAATSIAATSDAEWETATAAYDKALEAVDSQVGSIGAVVGQWSHALFTAAAAWPPRWPRSCGPSCGTSAARLTRSLPSSATFRRYLQEGRTGVGSAAFLLGCPT